MFLGRRVRGSLTPAASSGTASIKVAEVIMELEERGEERGFHPIMAPDFIQYMPFRALLHDRFIQLRCRSRKEAVVNCGGERCLFT